MKFSKTTIIVLFLVIGVAIYAFFATTTDRLIWRTTNAFEELDLPTSFELVDKTKKKIGGNIINSARVAQVRTYRVSMDMASTKETLLKLMRENEDVAIVIVKSIFDSKKYVVGEYQTYEEALEVVRENNDNRSKENDYYTITLGELHDIRLSMHPDMRGVSALEETCSPGWMGLESGTYMTVIFGDTEEDVSVELSNFDAKAVKLNLKKGGNVFSTMTQEGTSDYYTVTFGLGSSSYVVGKHLTHEEALEIVRKKNDNLPFEREFCNTDSDETYVTIVMWAIPDNEW